MLSYEAELEQLRPTLGDAKTDRLIARERREVFSARPELRVLAWGGAMLLATAAGIIITKHFDAIGPRVLMLLIAFAALACYAFVWRRRARASVIDDYVLLLGALLVSADAAFAQSQFHFFGEAWWRQFAVVAVLHAIVAYVFDSRVVLSLAIAAMAAWLGVREGEPRTTELALRMLSAAALTLLWREGDRRLRASRTFARTFEHFAANLALFAGLVLAFRGATRVQGVALTLLIAAGVIVWGFRSREEWFVLYAFLYAVVAVDRLLLAEVREPALSALVVLVSMIGAVAGLIAIHNRFRHAIRTDD